MPNPIRAGNYLFVNYKKKARGSKQLFIVNSLGKRIVQVNLKNQKGGVIRLNTTKMNPGIYFMSLITESANISRKFIIKD